MPALILLPYSKFLFAYNKIIRKFFRLIMHELDMRDPHSLVRDLHCISADEGVLQMRELIKKQLLLDFLDQRALDPILEAQPNQYSSERDRDILAEVQRNAAFEKEQFHRAESAKQIRDRYLNDLYLEHISRLGNALEDLELPRFRQLRINFLQLCKELEI